MLAKLTAEFRLDLLELDGCQPSTRPSINLWLIPDDLAAKRFREAADGLAEVPLEELDYRRREVKLVCAIKDVLLREVVLDQPLREVSNDLRRGRDLE